MSNPTGVYSNRVLKQKFKRAKQKMNFQRIISSDSDSSSTVDLHDDNEDDLTDNEAPIETHHRTDKFLEENYVPDNDDNIDSGIGNLVSHDCSSSLYENATITIHEAVNRLMQFFIKSNFDKNKVINMMRLIKSILPSPNKLPITFRQILRTYGKTPSSIEKFYCNNCFTLTTIKNDQQYCHNIKGRFHNSQLSKREVTEIVILNIREKLQSIIKMNFSLFTGNEKLFPSFDIPSGERYGIITKETLHPITLVIHADGAALVRSTKSALWPCFSAIVELPPPVREYQSNILTLGLWVSTIKPNVNLFLEGALYNRQVIYHYPNNNYRPRTHDEFIVTANQVEQNLTAGGKRCTSIRGIKGLSSMLKIFLYPVDIIYDYMHLVCLNHVPTLIKRFIGIISKAAIAEIDFILKHIKIPHEVNVKFIFSMQSIQDWKAKHVRIFVLNLGLPIMTQYLPISYSSHFSIYCLAIKILHCPKSLEEIQLAEKLIHYYCKTSSIIYDKKIELYSSWRTRFYISVLFRIGDQPSLKKAFGTKNLGSQMMYWCDIDCIIATTEYELPSPSLVNEIKLDGCLFIAYYDLFTKQLAGSQQDLNKIKLYLGFKDNFVTYHSLIYSKRFSCRLLKTNVSGRPYRSQRFAQEEKKFCCIVYIDEPSKYSIVETKRLIDMDENGYGSIKELGKHYAVHVEKTGTRESMERYGQLLEKALQSQMHEDIPSDCEDWALKNGKMNGSKHCRTTTASPSKSTINQQLASPSQNRIALRNVTFGEIPSSPGYVLHQRAPSCTSKNDSLNHEQSNNCAQDTTTSDDDSYFLHDVGEEVSSDEELDVTVKSSWNLKTSATGGSKSKKGLVKQKETSTPKRFRLLINNDDDNAHDDHLNLQHIFDYVKQINSNVLKLQKHQQHVTITLDRLEKILNTLCNNQKRLAKSLSKHKIPITLENDNQSVHTDDERSDSQDGVRSIDNNHFSFHLRQK
ncbi:unnamed protein product [Rotaria magnacalcarata]|uniref:Uncharacterized protein n=1 Tax=Rotaria magnacalcarata TaxID=392030 RepID=A0A816Q962_9BILA|nr:unnamed protein product [Rotaria magnacalcarata]